jgi:hypothetical protein
MSYYQMNNDAYHKDQQSRNLELFTRKYDAGYSMTTERRQNYQAVPMSWDVQYKGVPTTVAVTYETVVEIRLTEESLIRLIDDVNMSEDIARRYGRGPGALDYLYRIESVAATHDREHRIRQNNPTVKTAWDKYQMLLKIAGE